MSDQLPVGQDSGDEGLTFDYYVKARNGRKRDYVFSYEKARRCPHPHLMATAIGGNTYRCTECNWVFDIVTANMRPIHHLVASAALQLVHFGKEFGVNSLQEVLRQPHGTSDGTPHKGVIPDGMTLSDAVLALEEVDVTTEDGGAAQMRELVESVWPSEREIKRRVKALRGSDLPDKQVLADRLETLLEERRALAGTGNSHAIPDGSVPSMSETGE